MASVRRLTDCRTLLCSASGTAARPARPPDGREQAGTAAATFGETNLLAFHLSQSDTNVIYWEPLQRRRFEQKVAKAAKRDGEDPRTYVRSYKRTRRDLSTSLSQSLSIRVLYIVGEHEQVQRRGKEIDYDCDDDYDDY